MQPSTSTDRDKDTQLVPTADETIAAIRLLDDDAIHPLAEKLTENGRNLVDTMIEEGISAALAAERIGLTKRTGYNLIAKPEVMAYLEARYEVARKGLRTRSLAVVERAMDKGAADDASAAMLRAGLEAARFLNGEESRAAGGVTVNVMVPGYVIDLSDDHAKPQLADKQGQVLDLTAEADDAASGNAR